MEGKNNTALIVGVSVVGVLAIVITIIAVKSKSTANTQQYYNPYATATNPYATATNPYATATDKAALYTGAASVINNVLDTFFSGNNNKNTNSSSSNSSLTQAEWDAKYGDVWY